MLHLTGEKKENLTGWKEGLFQKAITQHLMEHTKHVDMSEKKTLSLELTW